MFIKDVDLEITEFKVKIADLGLARTLRDSSYVKKPYGTVTHMAPEIINGREYDYKADIWSIGTIVFQMITGIKPSNWAEML